MQINIFISCSSFSLIILKHCGRVKAKLKFDLITGLCLLKRKQAQMFIKSFSLFRTNVAIKQCRTTLELSQKMYHVDLQAPHALKLSESSWG